MGDRENTGQQQSTANTQAPLATAITPVAPNPQEPHAYEIENEPHTEPEKPAQWFKNPDWHMVWITVLLFAVGVYTACVFHRQFTEMQTQTGILNTQAQQAAIDSSEARRKGDEQLRLASKQVQAAQDSVKAINKQMRQDQRAWMKISAPSLLMNPSANQPWSILLHFSNIGKSPALNVFVQTNVEIVPHMQKSTLAYTGNHLHDFTGIVYPGDSYDFAAETFDAKGPIALGENYGKLIRGDAYIVYYAQINYRDIFGTKHWTHFCGWHYLAKGPNYAAGNCPAYDRVDNN
jgi:hypothetical protein